MGLLEEMNVKLDTIVAGINALNTVASSKTAEVEKKDAGKSKATAKHAAKEEQKEEPIADEEFDFLGQEEQKFSAEEVANNCKKIMDAKKDKKAFRSGFVEVLNKEFGVDSVAKIPAEKLGQLMQAIEKLGAAIQ